MVRRHIVMFLALTCGVAGCAPQAPVAGDGPVAEVKPGGCETLRDADFEGAGAQRLRDYLAWIAHSHGAQAGVTPQQVSLAIARGDPEPGPFGVQAGEVSCAAGAHGRGPYRVTLFRDALVGRPQAVAYHTLAHEFYHLVQIRRAKLACEAQGSAVPYEKEADEFARSVVPRCRR